MPISCKNREFTENLKDEHGCPCFIMQKLPAEVIRELRGDLRTWYEIRLGMRDGKPPRISPSAKDLAARLEMYADGTCSYQETPSLNEAVAQALAQQARIVTDNPASAILKNVEVVVSGLEAALNGYAIETGHPELQRGQLPTLGGRAGLGARHPIYPK